MEYPECETYVPVTSFKFHPLYQDETPYYDQYSRILHVLGIHAELNDYYLFKEFDTSLTIQGFDYNNCHYRESTDSLGVIWQLAIDRYYGIVLLSYRDRYRWERVLEW
jgi:hypothetical protein